IPLSIKKVLWYIFKSPQRELGVVRSINIEVQGWISLLASKYLHPHKKLLAVSICTGLKNRSDNYISYVLESANKMENKTLLELCIFDCYSTDIPDLEAKIKKTWSGKVKFETMECEFTRSFTFNKAIALATSPLIFACDADMLLPYDLVNQCNKHVTNKTVWFPVCFNLKKNRPASVHPNNGAWLTIGTGMFASYKWQFDKIGGFDTSFVTWGGEDWDVYRRFWKGGFMPYRSMLIGLFHNYHPSLDPNIQRMERENKKVKG
ncbi:MAG: galactosyltransferase-related protein, partial [Bacteroidota bacterium]|nr:galactosyltransferase-related protein [Bacteroidota bacterium]